MGILEISGNIYLVNKNKLIIAGLGAIFLIVVGFVIYSMSDKAVSNLQPFAVCLKEKGATFYGAFWCPHCQAQKKLFGSAANDLNYIECSTPDGNAQTEICKDKKIESYPTWEFADLSRVQGEMSLSDLASKTSCSLPN